MYLSYDKLLLCWFTVLCAHTQPVCDENISVQFTATSLSLWLAHLEWIGWEGRRKIKKHFKHSKIFKLSQLIGCVNYAHSCCRNAGCESIWCRGLISSRHKKDAQRKAILTQVIQSSYYKALSTRGLFIIWTVLSWQCFNFVSICSFRHTGSICVCVESTRALVYFSGTIRRTKTYSSVSL